VFRSSVITVL